METRRSRIEDKLIGVQVGIKTIEGVNPLLKRENKYIKDDYKTQMQNGKNGVWPEQNEISARGHARFWLGKCNVVKREMEVLIETS